MGKVLISRMVCDSGMKRGSRREVVTYILLYLFIVQFISFDLSSGVTHYRIRFVTEE